MLHRLSIHNVEPRAGAQLGFIRMTGCHDGGERLNTADRMPAVCPVEKFKILEQQRLHDIPAAALKNNSCLK